MAASTQQIKKRRAELAEIGKEIDMRIVKIEKMPTAGKQGYKEMKKIFADREAAAEAKFRKSLMSSGGEAWDFAWENIWEALREFQRNASPETRQNYAELETSLQARQSYLMALLNLPAMSCDQVWAEVWSAVWSVIRAANDKYKRSVTDELIQCDKELKILLDKQLALQTELDKLSARGNSFLRRP